MGAINGLTYGWSDITINILGRDVKGITAINYSEEQELENIYGAGNEPIGRGKGQYKAEASVTLKKEEVLALQAIAPKGRLSDIGMFDIVVKYGVVPGKFVTDIIQNCQIMGNKRDVKSGDKSIDVELKLIVSAIKFNQ